MNKKKPEPLVLGWREWIALPDLGIPLVKVKVDTGARTSSLHVTHLRERTSGGTVIVSFTVHPIQHSRAGDVQAEAALLDRRHVRSSNGISELRPIIMTTITIGGQTWEVELALTSRDTMGFRMLLGRRALRKRAIVDPARSFLQPRSKLRQS